MEINTFAKIDGKKSKYQSTYLETEIWDRDEILFIVKYKELHMQKWPL